MSLRQKWRLRQHRVDGSGERVDAWWPRSAAAVGVPNNCQNCGTSYPWRQEAIANAIEVVQM